MIVVTTAVVTLLNQTMKLKNQIKSLLKYVLLAPSGYNSQPWKFKLGDDSLEILPDYDRARINTDPDYREFFMSLGAAAANLQVSADHFGLAYEKSYRLDNQKNDYAIIFKFSKENIPPTYSPLFSAIKTRHTNRFPYENINISKNILADLKKIPHSDSIELNLITRPGDITSFSKLIRKSILAWHRNQLMVEELETWLRDDLEISKDGLPTSVLSLYKLGINAKYFLLKDDPDLVNRSLHHQNLAKNAPALGLISTKSDTVEDLFSAGEFFELFFLTLAAHGLTLDFFNHPLTMNKTRQETAKAFSSHFLSQLLFRFGSPTIIPPRTPRRPLRDLIIS